MKTVYTRGKPPSLRVDLAMAEVLPLSTAVSGGAPRLEAGGRPEIGKEKKKEKTQRHGQSKQFRGFRNTSPTLPQRPSWRCRRCLATSCKDLLGKGREGDKRDRK